MYIFLLMEILFKKRWYCNGFPIRACHSWHLYGWIGKKFITKAILLYDKLEALRDDTIAYVKPDAIDHLLSILNSFYENILFTYEPEINGKISFLDILILRNGNSLENTVHRKSTHNDIYYIGNHLHHIHGNVAHLEH